MVARSRWLFISAAYLAAATLASCSGHGDAFGDGGPPISDKPYSGPTITASVMQQHLVEPPQFVTVIEVIAPTGGWQVQLDEAIIDTDEHRARLFITLTAPGDDEMVTQALETHHVTYRDEQEYAHAIVFARQHERDESPPATYHEVPRMW